MSRWLVTPGEPLKLADRPTRTTAGAPGGKAKTKAASQELRAELEELQARLYAESEQSLLVVLQALDAGGKDGTVRSVFAGVNPQGVKVHSFKEPTPEELAHDFLWRVHPHAPRHGDIAIFNRSHYEDVLVTRVHALIHRHEWEARYEQIRAFEATLAGARTRIVKVFLHISPEEQRERLQARIDVPRKRWKFAASDLAERKHWDEYQRAYEDALAATSADDAPWFVVGADRKWYRDWAVLTILVEALRDMDPRYPQASADAEGTVV